MSVFAREFLFRSLPETLQDGERLQVDLIIPIFVQLICQVCLPWCGASSNGDKEEEKEGKEEVLL